MKLLKNPSALLRTLLVAALPLCIPVDARAADHGDAPSLAHDQAADIADIFFFLDPNDNSKAVLIATIHGFIVPGEAVNFGLFDPVMRYRIEIENTGDATADRFIDVNFSQRLGAPDPNRADPDGAGPLDPNAALEIPLAQTATVRLPRVGAFRGGAFGGLPVLNPNLGAGPNTPTSTPILSGGQPTGVDFFAGLVDDPFFFDIPGFARFIASVRAGSPDLTRLERGRDSFGGYNILAFALRVPVTLLKGPHAKIGVRFAAQRRLIESPTLAGETRARGPFKTVDSMGNPAVNVALIPFSKKNSYNTQPPAVLARNRFAGDILATLKALGTTGFPADADEQPTGNLLALVNVAVSTGDFLRLDPAVANLPTDMIGGGAPDQGTGFPNGRRLRDDTVDILLGLINTATAAEGDNVDANISQFPQTAAFPFLAPAQQPVASGGSQGPTATDDTTQN